MNIYKKSRDQFFDKYFPYPKELELAIRCSDPEHLLIESNCDVDLYSVRNIDSSRGLIKLLNKSNFRKTYRYYYIYNRSRISDWASLYWNENEGLYIHSEWMGIEGLDGNLDLDMDRDFWNFLFSKREIIFRHFYPEILLRHYRVEDLFKRITDSKLKTIKASMTISNLKLKFLLQKPEQLYKPY
jgi:hypothetical protein